MSSGGAKSKTNEALTFPLSLQLNTVIIAVAVGVCGHLLGRRDW